MSQDLFHIDPKKIPPRRRLARIDGVGRSRTAKPRAADRLQPELETSPEFDFLPLADFDYQPDYVRQADSVLASELVSDPLTEIIFQGVDDTPPLPARPACRQAGARLV